jgi:hypothetical protein
VTYQQPSEIMILNGRIMAFALIDALIVPYCKNVSRAPRFLCLVLDGKLIGRYGVFAFG